MIKDIYVDKSQYYLQNNVILILESDNKNYQEVDVFVNHLEHQVYNLKIAILGEKTRIDLGKFPIGGYQVKIDDCFTAFDVVNKSSESPRYGFLSDFTSKDYEKNIKQMSKLHLNLIQFYDWMYRHHELIPKEDIFIDPMGRSIDNKVVNGKISSVHDYNMKAIAYGAIYGSEKEYYENNTDELLHFNDGEPILFINIIGMMDISSNTRWRKHIIKEFGKAIEIMDFDGIHLDQYGFPKYSKSNKNALIDLAKEIPTFINDTIDYTHGMKDEVIIDFNYVNNWPIDTVSDSKQEFSYIEVWSPNDTYNDLARILIEAKLLSNNRPVVLAAYIHAFQGDSNMNSKELSALFTMACVYSQGAYPLLFGEYNGILSDPYYVNYSRYSDEFFAKVRSYQDFIVKYKELLFEKKRDITYTFANGINEEVVVKNVDTSSDYRSNTIALKIFENPKFKTIHLINLLEQSSSLWNEPKEDYKSHKNIEVKYLIYEEIEGIYVMTPDDNKGDLIEINYNYVDHPQGKAISFIVPNLDIWTMIYIKLNRKNKRC